MEDLAIVHCVLAFCVIPEECTGALDTFLSGVNVPTLPMNQNVLKGSGKSQRKQIISTLKRSVKRKKENHETKSTYYDLVFAYCLQWFKSQKGKKPVRILPPPSSRNSAESQITASQHQSSNSESLGDLKVAISGFPKDSFV